MSRPVFRPTLFLLSACLVLSGLRAQPAPQAAFPAQSWQLVSSPEATGWSKAKLAEARQYADSIHSSAVMIIQHGKVIDEWGDIDKKINGYSMRKSLISALYGIYSAEGVIDLNETLEHAGIDETS